MSDYTCAKCHGTQYDRGEIRTEGGWLSAAFDISNHRFTTVSCLRCGYTELYRADIHGGAQLFDFLVT